MSVKNMSFDCLTSSGELKNPSEAIPKGTIIAVSYTFTVYLLLFLLLSSTCDRCHMEKHYAFTQCFVFPLIHLSFIPPVILLVSLSQVVVDQ